jgi:hypothetical protein
LSFFAEHGTSAVDVSIIFYQYSTQIWAIFSAGVSALGAWLLSLRNANASIERARIKMSTEVSTAEVAERASFRATLMAEVGAMRILMKECETDKYLLRDRLNMAEAQILILKASNEIMERWVTFFKDRNSPNARPVPQYVVPAELA